MIIEHTVMVIGGLGLFIASLRLLTAALRRVSTYRTRKLIAQFTRSGGRGLACGVAAGLLTQSMATVLFMAIGFVRMHAMSVEATLPLLVGANLGTSALAIATAFPTDVIALLLLGISGFRVGPDTDGGVRLGNIVFSISLLFVALKILKTGLIPLLSTPAAVEAVQTLHGSVLGVAVLACALRIVLPSTVAIIVLASTLTEAHVLDPSQAVGIVAGAVAGSGFSLLTMAQEGDRVARLVAGGVVAANLFGAGCVAALLVIDAQAPFLGSSAQKLGIPPALGLGLALIAAYLPGVALVPLRRPISRLLNRLVPVSGPAELESLRYIDEKALADPASAVELARLEQRELAGLLALYFDRSGERPPQTPSLAQADRAFTGRAQRLGSFFEELAAAQLPNEAYERVAGLIAGQRTLEAIAQAARELNAGADRGGGALARIHRTIFDGLHAVALTLDAAMADGGADDLAMLHAMTADRGGPMQRIRESVIEREAGLDPGARLQLLTVTNLCERIFWLIAELLKTPICQPTET